MLLFSIAALWLRLSERLKFPLPLNRNYQNEIWKLISKRTCFDFYQIECERPTVKSINRREYYFGDGSDEAMSALMKSNYYIYSYDPVDDPIIRGSCKEFLTRIKLDSTKIKAMSLDEVEQK